MRGLLGNQLVTQKTVLFILNTLHLSATGNYLVTRVSVVAVSLFCAMFCSLGIAGNHLVTRDMGGCFCLYYGLEL